jgi:glycosyltransferase involved in cell wall biosynthesis
MGGPAHQAALLSGRRFFPDRYETLLVHGRLAPGEESAADLSEREGARMLHLPELVQPVHGVHDPVALAKLTRITRRFRPHIVHTHTAKAGFLGRQAAAMAATPRPKLVHTFHGHVLEGYFGRAKNTLYRRLERALATRTDRLIGVSEATVSDLVRLGVAGRERFRVVPLGLDLDRFADCGQGSREAARKELRVGEDEVLCTFVGRVVPIKQLDLLLEAIAEARKRDERIRLMIVGDGEQRPELEALAERLGIGAALHFAGYRGDLVPVWAASDIAVLSSANEGTPVSLIEAAAAGVPAVATDVGGVRETLAPDASIVVPAADRSALADSIAALASDPDRRARLGERARQHALAHFGAERLLADIDGVYRGLLGSARG